MRRRLMVTSANRRKPQKIYLFFHIFFFTKLLDWLVVQRVRLSGGGDVLLAFHPEVKSTYLVVQNQPPFIHLFHLHWYHNHHRYYSIHF